ncbi:hypothetical protein CCACVL1_12762 [Corchorus capsularis]|uniref:N-acetyltransferase domain-containing protein n=1 Tax=Corchorus capsularis TaxID=210143 RepID=A0A1R3IDV3_COCAP|nr:hypothetical protein CCACVL1_12762 [Corchorus capsularis]
MGEITLRPYELSDIDEFLEWANDEEVIRLSRLDRFNSREDALCYFKEVVMPHPCYRAICLDGRPIGFIAFDPAGSGIFKCRGYIGYALGSKYRGQGLTTKAVKMLTSAVFKEFPEIEKVEAAVDVENKASQRVLEKAGYQKEGLLRKWMVFKEKTTDVFLFGILSTDHVVSTY